MNLRKINDKNLQLYLNGELSLPTLRSKMNGNEPFEIIGGNIAPIDRTKYLSKIIGVRHIRPSEFSVIIPAFRLNCTRLKNFVFHLNELKRARFGEIIVVEQVDPSNESRLLIDDPLVSHIQVQIHGSTLKTGQLVREGVLAATKEYLIVSNSDLYVDLALAIKRLPRNFKFFRPYSRALEVRRNGPPDEVFNGVMPSDCDEYKAQVTETFICKKSDFINHFDMDFLGDVIFSNRVFSGCFIDNDFSFAQNTDAYRLFCDFQYDEFLSIEEGLYSWEYGLDYLSGNPKLRRLNDTTFITSFFGDSEPHVQSTRRALARILSQNPLPNIIFIEATESGESLFEDLFDSNVEHIIVKARECNRGLMQKEALFNIAADRCKHSKYLIFNDSDISSTDPLWLAKVRNRLAAKPHSVVQCFRNISETNCDGFRWSLMACKRYRGHMNSNDSFDDGSVPGGSWAMTRDFFDRLGGWNPYCLLSGGDSVFVSEVVNNSEYPDVVMYLANEMRRDGMPRVPCNFVDVDVVHESHSDPSKRMGSCWYPKFAANKLSPVKERLMIAENGLLTWRDENDPLKMVVERRGEIFDNESADRIVEEELNRTNNMLISFDSFLDDIVSRLKLSNASICKVASRGYATESVRSRSIRMFHIDDLRASKPSKRKFDVVYVDRILSDDEMSTFLLEWFPIVKPNGILSGMASLRSDEMFHLISFMNKHGFPITLIRGHWLISKIG